MLQFLNLALQLSLGSTLAFLLAFFQVPLLFLRGLHTYVQPENVAQNSSGLKAAIRRPSDSGTSARRSKSRDKFEFDEQKAQIFRIKLEEAHLLTRLYVKDYRDSFNLTFVALSCLLLHKYLGVSPDSGVFANGSFLPVLLGFVGVCRLLVSLAKASLEKSASKRSEKHLSISLGSLGFLFGLMVCFEIAPPAFAFEFGSLDVSGRVFLAVCMGCIVGFLYMAAGKNARLIWLGTDQIRCNLSIISCGWFGRMVVYANFLLTILTALLWINPFAELLVNENIGNGRDIDAFSRTRGAEKLVGKVGMSRSDFAKFRLWCMMLSGLLQIVALRTNIQLFLNEAVLSWYQRLHASRVPDLDFSRAKVFLHNHYLCLVSLQFFVPPALVLLFLGLSQVDGFSFENFPLLGSLLPSYASVKDLALFMAWWVVFVWAVFTSVGLVLYRRGILYVS